MAPEPRIGTSGWSYRHWRGSFYPAGLPAAEEFGYYCRHFTTVELNSSFYRLPTATAFARWNGRSPPSFQFAVKASRYLTHLTRLSAARPALALLMERAVPLDGKFGPLLFQLPPRWAYDGERFAAFISALPAGHPHACEFRDPSWHNEHAYGLMRQAQVGLCLHDLGGMASPAVITAPLIYIRFHGAHGTYSGSYADAILADWARRIAGWHAEGHRVHAYFNNDAEGHAPRNAMTLSRMCRARSGR